LRDLQLLFADGGISRAKSGLFCDTIVCASRNDLANAHRFDDRK